MTPLAKRGFVILNKRGENNLLFPSLFGDFSAASATSRETAASGKIKEVFYLNSYGARGLLIDEFLGIERDYRAMPRK